MTTIKIGQWRARIRMNVFVGLVIMWVSVFLYAGAPLFTQELFEQSLGLILFAYFLGFVGALIASLEFKHVQ